MKIIKVFFYLPSVAGEYEQFTAPLHVNHVVCEYCCGGKIISGALMIFMVRSELVGERFFYNLLAVGYCAPSKVHGYKSKLKTLHANKPYQTYFI